MQRLAVAISLLAVAACAPLPAPEPPSGARPVGPDRGDLFVEYLPSENPNHEYIRQVLVASREFDDIARHANESFNLPADITAFFMDCGQANAFYDPNQRTIAVCYELIEKYTVILTEEGDPQQVIDDEIIYSALFTFFHELGHALADQLQLPVVGREEDVVDEFAAILLIENDDTDAVYAGMDQFDVDAEEEMALEELPYWDEHGLGAQRFYNLACLVFGSDPEGHWELVEAGDLPEDRAVRCPDEYERRLQSWDRLLAPHLKP